MTIPGVELARGTPDQRDAVIDLVWSTGPACGAQLAADGAVTEAELRGVVERADVASYLNPHVPDAAYYVLALAVTDDVRGAGVGAALLENAMARGRRAGCRTLHLDVLSDNPAVGFYRSHGLETMAETVAPGPCREHGVPMELRMVTMLAGGAVCD
jgi:ribosomal protein S18 acetylase RimI-like enzyme